MEVVCECRDSGSVSIRRARGYVGIPSSKVHSLYALLKIGMGQIGRTPPWIKSAAAREHILSHLPT